MATFSLPDVQGVTFPCPPPVSLCKLEKSVAICSHFPNLIPLTPVGIGEVATRKYSVSCAFQSAFVTLSFDIPPPPGPPIPRRLCCFRSLVGSVQSKKNETFGGRRKTKTKHSNSRLTTQHQNLGCYANPLLKP